jgi:lipase chaperone LimK
MDSERTSGRARWLLVVAGGLALAFGARQLRAEATTSAPVATSTPARAAAPASVKAAVATLAKQAAPQEATPASLRGTDEDGSLATDESGNLVVGPGILAFFNYHLSATGEIDAATIQARILARIRARLPERAAGQAATLLDRYLAYRQATQRLRDDGDSASRLDALHRLRQSVFGDDDAAKLFADQERTDAVALAEQRVHQDATLTKDERTARLSALEENLPEAVRAARAGATLPVREQQEEAARLAAGAGKEEIRSYRVATVGEAAADRLEVLDAEEEAWTKRLQAYRAACAAIAKKTSDPEAIRAQVASLREASFNPQEQLRVAALDGMAAAPEGE